MQLFILEFTSHGDMYGEKLYDFHNIYQSRALHENKFQLATFLQYEPSSLYDSCSMGAPLTTSTSIWLHRISKTNASMSF